MVDDVFENKKFAVCAPGKGKGTRGVEDYY
jgi:hypothetical protein